MSACSVCGALKKTSNKADLQSFSHLQPLQGLGIVHPQRKEGLGAKLDLPNGIQQKSRFLKPSRSLISRQEDTLRTTRSKNLIGESTYPLVGGRLIAPG